MAEIGNHPGMADTGQGCPIDAARLERATPDDAAELMVLQRCCWVDEAIANDTFDVPALRETVDEVTSWIGSWDTWVVRLDGRLIGAVRARRAGNDWEIGRLMVAPDLAGRGLGRWLLAHAESAAPDGVEAISLYTGKQSLRNIAMYQRAGFELTDDPAPHSAVSLRKPVSRSSA